MERTRINSSHIVQSAGELSKILKGHQISPGQYMAHCPAHDDRTPSFAIRDNPRGSIDFYCHAGCSAKSVFEAFELRGISLNGRTKLEYYPGLPQGITSVCDGKKYVAHWQYSDLNSNPIGYVVRYESSSGEKTYLPYFRKDGNRWKTGYHKKVKRPLYNIENLARNPSEVVFIVEGEKAADALQSIGILSTTFPGGANSASQADWSPLADRHCIIWPDNDKAGKIFAVSVFTELNNICESEFACEEIEVEKLDLPEKGDAYDFIETGDVLKRDILDLPKIEINNIEDAGVIEVNTARYHEAMDRAEELLLRKIPYAIFQDEKKDMILRVIETPNDAYIQRINRNEFITDLLSRNFEFIKYVGGKPVPIAPPVRMVDEYFSRTGLRKLWVLNGIITAPLFKSDGNLLDRPGYDRKTGLYYVLRGEPFPGLVPFADNMTPEALKKIAIAKLREIDDLFADFEFITPADRSVVLSAILTSLTRRNYTEAPAFGFNSPVAGSGKTLLANCVHIIGTGARVQPMTLGFSREETDKAVFASLLEGRTILLIDNADLSIQSSQLCEMITSPSGKHQGRILGQSEMKTVNTNVLFLFTGINLTFVGQMTRRVLLCSIDPGCEKPENRTGFIIADLPGYVQQNRNRFVAAALSVIKAYQLAGSPRPDIPVWGGFTQWSAWCRDPLVWAGYDDPYKTQIEVDRNDPERDSVKSIFLLWHKVYQTDWKKVIDVVQDCNNAIEEKHSDESIFDLAMALRDIAGKGKFLDNNMVGQWLRRRKGKEMAGLKLVCHESKHTAKRWRIYETRPEK